jgi:hypothetical protein
VRQPVIVEGTCSIDRHHSNKILHAIGDAVRSEGRDRLDNLKRIDNQRIPTALNRRVVSELAAVEDREMSGQDAARVK